MAFGKQLGNSSSDSFDEIKRNLSDGKAVLLDVRGQEERDLVHLKDSIFIPGTEIKSLEPGVSEVGDLPKDKIVYCH